MEHGPLQEHAFAALRVQEGGQRTSNGRENMAPGV